MPNVSIALSLSVIALGAVIGAWARWCAGLIFNPLWHGFPLGTLIVNCAGGLMVGALVQWLSLHPNDLLRLALITGFLGALTTFSAFSAESLLMMTQGKYALALAHTMAHVVGSLLCATLGMWLIRLFQS